ncbi:MAG TPA: hypothetical protein VHX60_01420 [Acidobacteriaceae bacterium]|nr:hypothetical protein [Acidobacteriaceae bacterium]
MERVVGGEDGHAGDRAVESGDAGADGGQRLLRLVGLGVPLGGEEVIAGTDTISSANTATTALTLTVQ